jgi:O-acetyl-ADP-ribose deacetylase (regulator of RNase III)
MIEFRQDSIFTADAEALVNTVNCVGVMGRGIALQFRKAFPENFAAYKAACDRGEVRPGKLFIHSLGQLTNPRYIINFPTKGHWRGNSRIEYIDSGLKEMVEAVRQLDVHSIAIPPLGCGLGGLAWADVRPRIEQALQGLPDIHVLVYEPGGAPLNTKVL